MIIRKEQTKDYEEVYDVVKRAFENAEQTDHDEHNLVTRLRNSDAFVPELSLIAEVDNAVVGHILFTKIQIGGKVALALAPVSVFPEFQNRGVGSKLICEGHKIAGALGYCGVVVLGHENYYPKFGYKRASLFNITPPFDVPEKNFMAIELCENGLNDYAGVVEYAKEFFI